MVTTLSKKNSKKKNMLKLQVTEVYVTPEKTYYPTYVTELPKDEIEIAEDGSVDINQPIFKGIREKSAYLGANEVMVHPILDV